MRRILALAFLLLAFAVNAQSPAGEGSINAGMIYADLNARYPGVVVSVTMPDADHAFINSWTSTSTEEQRAAATTYLANLDFTLLKAQQAYNRNYAAFNARTSAIEAAGFDYQGKRFHADAVGIANIQSLMIASGALAYPYTIYDGDATWELASAADVQTLGAAVFAFVGGVRASAKPLRDALKQQAGESSAEWLTRMQTWTESR